MRIVSPFQTLAAFCSGNRGAKESRTSSARTLRLILGVPVQRSTSCPQPAVNIMSIFLPGDVEQEPIEKYYLIYLVLGGLGMLAFLGLGMVAARKRRHEHGRLWLPEGFKTTDSKKKRREPVGEDSVGLK